jgi:formate dehydrogenase maturation protein FdhE
MTRPVDVTERVGQWKQAYDAIREELTPNALRDILAAMEQVEGVAQLGSYMSLARNVMANDRAAGTIAAMLVATGIKPHNISYEEEQ